MLTSAEHHKVTSASFWYVQEMPDEHTITFGEHAGLAKSQVFQGTCAYQVLADSMTKGSTAGDRSKVPERVPFPGCSILYACQEHRALYGARHFFAPDQLVSEHDIVPGLARVDSSNERTLAISDRTKPRTVLDEPAIVPSQSVALPQLSFFLDEVVAMCVPVLILIADRSVQVLQMSASPVL